MMPVVEARSTLSRLRYPLRPAWTPRLADLVSKPWAFVASAGIVLAAVAIRFAAGPHFVDDAYITFRYARNLAAGEGFVYNLGEHVLGTSTPLLTILLAAASRLGIGLENAALHIGVTSDAAAILIFWRLGLGLKAELVGIATGLLYALAPVTVLASVSGMETSLYLMLLVLTFYLCFRGRYPFAGATAALAALTRPEGILLVIAVCAVPFLVARRFPWWSALTGAAVLLPWVIFATLYFGSPLPNSVLAKAIIYSPDPVPTKNLLEILGQIADPFLIGPVVPLAYLALALIGGGIAASRNARLVPMLAWMLLDILFFALPNRYLFPWYTVPLVPFFFFLVVLALAGASSWLASRFRGNASGLVYAALVETIFVIVMALAPVATFVALKETDQASARRESVYACIGRELAARDPNAVVSSPEIGALGYTFKGRIVDLAGLVSPSVLPYYLASGYRFQFPFIISSRLIIDRSPAVIVSFDSTIPYSHEQWFEALYSPALEYKQLNPVYGSLIVFVRSDIKWESPIGSQAQLECTTHD